MASAALRASVDECACHLGTLADYADNQKPLRAKVDRQSFDDLKPGYDSALAILEWHEGLVNAFTSVVGAAASSGQAADDEMIARAVDACVLLENQFVGWSNMTNRFSWFKRTFTVIRAELQQSGIDTEAVNSGISRFQMFIGPPAHPPRGVPTHEHAPSPPAWRLSHAPPALLCAGNASLPIGTHLTGPLRSALKKVAIPIPAFTRPRHGSHASSRR